MATGFDIFGATIRDWLEEPDNDEAEPVPLLLAASDDYTHKSPSNGQVAGHSHSCFAPTKSDGNAWLNACWRNGDRLRYLRRDVSCSCHFQLQRVVSLISAN